MTYLDTAHRFSDSRERQAINEASGVTLGTINVSSPPYHIEASWTTRPLDHTEIIMLTFPSPPRWAAFGMRPEAVLFRRGDSSEVPGMGIGTFGSCCVDCSRSCDVGFFLDSSTLIPIGVPTTIPFEWSWFCTSTGGGSLTVSDTKGWIVSWSPASVAGGPSCGLCFVDRNSGSFDVLPPIGVPVGTTSEVTLEAAGSRATVTVVTMAPTSAHRSTWGGVKAIYR